MTTDLAVADRGFVEWSPVRGTICVDLLDRESFKPADLGGVLAFGIGLVLLARDRVEGIAQEEPTDSCITPGCVPHDPKRFRVTGTRR